MAAARASSTATSATCSARPTTRCTRISTAQVRAAGLSSIEWRVLATLHDSEPLTVSQLALRGAVQAAHRHQAGPAHDRTGLGRAAGRPDGPAPHAGGRHPGRPAAGAAAAREGACARSAAAAPLGASEQDALKKLLAKLAAAVLATRSRAAAAPLASPSMPDRKEHLDTLAITLLLACCAVLGPPADPHQDHRGRGAAAVAGLDPHRRRHRAAVAVVRWRAACRCSSATARCRAGLLAGALFAGEFTCIYIGLQHTTASRLTVFLYTSPFVVALLLPRFVPAERLRGVQWVGPGHRLRRRGAGLQRELRPQHARAQLRGDALALAAGVLWGLTTLAIRTTKLATASAEKTLFYQIAVTAAVSPVLSLLLGERWSLRVLGLRLVLDRPADRDRRLRELPGVDVDAAALPGHAACRPSPS